MPKLELASIPGLSGSQALFGTPATQGPTYSEIIVDIMVYLYDTTHD